MRKITDSQLRQATALVRTSMLTRLDHAEIPACAFSADFERNMQALRRKSHGRQRIDNIIRYGIAAILALILGTALFFTVNVEARAAVITWVKEVLAGRTAYRFTGEPQGALPEYTLTWVPESVECIFDEATEDSHAAIYTSPNNPQLGFTLHYAKMQDGTAAIILYNEAEDSVIPVDICDRKGELYISRNPERTHCLIWFDEERKITFSMTSYLEPEVMLHIAEGVKPAE